jgi:flagellar motor switch protein FliN/FliY
MTVNKDELRELIESDLFGDGAFSLDDLVTSEKKSNKKSSKSQKGESPNKFLETDLSIESFDEAILEKEIDSISAPDSSDDSELPAMNFDDIDALSEPLNLDASSFEEDIASLKIDDLESFDQDTSMNSDVSTSAPFDWSDDETPDVDSSSEQSLEAFFEDVEKRLDSVEKDVFVEQPIETFEPLPQVEFVPEPVFSFSEEPFESAPAPVPSVAYEPVVEQAPPMVDRVDVRPIEFPDLQAKISGQSFDLGFFANIPVKIDVYLGDTTISLKDVYDLTEGAIVSLDKLFGEPLELRINGQAIAKGEVVAVDKQYGIMIKEIIRSNS